MKPRPEARHEAKPSGGGRLVWGAYAVGFLCFAAGLGFVVADQLLAGAVLSVVGVVFVMAAYVGPNLPWAVWLERLKPAAKPLKKGSPAVADGLAPKPFSASDALEGMLSLLGEADTWRVNRLFLLAPVILFLTASAVLSINSTAQAAIAFVVAVFILWVYLQDMARPLELPHLRQNLRALIAQVPALPFQCWGIWLLADRYSDPAMVWLGFFACAAASGWMYFAMGRWPLDLRPEEVPAPTLGWVAPRPFYTPLRVSVITGMVALAAVAACLAVYVFPGDEAALSVASAFLAMLLLVGSFPWTPSGLAFAPQTPPAAGALVAVAAAAVAFALGAHAQDLVEAGIIHTGLWFFLAGAIVLVLGLSRFGVDRDSEENPQAGAWPRLEVAAVLLLVAVAFAMRIWKIDSFPFGVEGDEGGGGVWARDVLIGNVENHFIHQNYPLAFFSVTSLFFKLAGISLATLRWHSVFFGTLSVLTAYFFMRLNMGRTAAFLATLLMTFSYWHLHFSRFGHYNIEQVALQMAAFYFVFKALRTRKLWQWAVGGAAFGLAMFPHMAGRILPFEGLALVLYFFMARRDLLRSHLPGFLAFIVIAWAVSSPAVVYWKRAQSVSMGRINDVSIFDKNNTNAPLDTLGGFVVNCKVSMLMFNYQGDTRERDNPVAPDKILEHWMAVLFALAFLYTLYHWREPVNFFLLGVFFLNLCASVFSVEAPQTLRTAGNIPIVFAFMALPLADLGAALRRAGRLQARAVFLILLAAFAFFSWRSARRLFVDRRDLSFDAEPTYIAQVAGIEGGPDTQAVFWGTGFASSHPPMELLRQNTPLRNFYGPFEYLPITQATTHDHLLFLGDDYQQMAPYVEWLYPGIPVRSIPDQHGDPMALYLRVNKGTIARTEGLNGWVRVQGKKVPVTGADPGWPLAGFEGAREADLQGSLSVDAFGTYGISVSGEGDVSVRLDGRLLFSRRDGSVERHPALLAKGLHDLDLHLGPASSSDVMRLRLNGLKAGPAAAPWSLNSLAGFDVDKTHALRMPANGFFGEYFDSLIPKGQPVLETVEPVVLNHWLDSPLVGNWSVRWRTRFKVTVPGSYSFSVDGGNSTQVKVDSRMVWRQGNSLGGGPARLLPAIQLAKGWHEYEAEFDTTGGPGCALDWTTPDGKTGVFWVPDMRPVP